MAAERRDGFQPTAGPQDETKLLHPMLVPWADLPESWRDKDREPVRALPQMLRLAGLEIVQLIQSDKRSQLRSDTPATGDIAESPTDD